MITQTVLTAILGSIVSFLDKINFVFDVLNSSFMNSFLSVVGTVAYFFPWAKLVPIFGFIVGLQSFRIFISLLKLIKNLLPF
jgi:hypothetical protein